MFIKRNEMVPLVAASSSLFCGGVVIGGVGDAEAPVDHRRQLSPLLAGVLVQLVQAGTPLVHEAVAAPLVVAVQQLPVLDGGRQVVQLEADLPAAPGSRRLLRLQLLVGGVESRLFGGTPLVPVAVKAPQELTELGGGHGPSALLALVGADEMLASEGVFVVDGRAHGVVHA